MNHIKINSTTFQATFIISMYQLTQSDIQRWRKSRIHGISLIYTTGFKSPLLVLWAKLYCKSLIFHRYYILRFSPLTLFRWNLISCILSCYIVTMHYQNIFTWYLISWKQFIHGINPTRNLRLLQYFSVLHLLQIR